MHTAVKGYCLCQRSGKALENRFDDVMRILAVKHADVQREACLHCQSTEEFLRHFGIVNAKLYLRNIRIKNKIRTAAEIKAHLHQRFIHRQKQLP